MKFRVVHKDFQREANRKIESPIAPKDIPGKRNVCSFIYEWASQPNCLPCASDVHCLCRECDGGQFRGPVDAPFYNGASGVKLPEEGIGDAVRDRHQREFELPKRFAVFDGEGIDLGGLVARRGCGGSHDGYPESMSVRSMRCLRDKGLTRSRSKSSRWEVTGKIEGFTAEMNFKGEIGGQRSKSEVSEVDEVSAG